MDHFRALVIDLVEEKTEMSVRQLSLTDLAEGDVTIRVAYSSVNFKDGMATIPNQIIQTYPLIPGIDLAGTIIESTDKALFRRRRGHCHEL